MPYLGNVPSSFNVGTNNIDNDAITTEKIAAGAVVNADVNAAAAIAGTKISPDFGSQNILTTGTSTAASFSPSSSTVPSNGVYLPSANNLAISTNGTGRLFVDSSGRLGLGTSSVNTKLEIAGSNDAVTENNTLRFTDTDANTEANQQIGKIEFYSSDASTPGAGVKAYIGAFAADTTPDAYLAFATQDGSVVSTPVERLRITSEGKVGIGTSSPQTLLNLASATGTASPTPTTLRIQTTSSAADWSTSLPWGRLDFFSSDTSNSGPKTHAAIDVTAAGAAGGVSNLSLKTNDASGDLNSVLTATFDGKVGIGTTSPSDKLHIDSGNIRITGSNPQYIQAVGINLNLNTDSQNILFSRSGTEMARFDSSSRFLVGTSTAQGQSIFQAVGNSSASTDPGDIRVIRGLNISSIGTNVGAELGIIKFGALENSVCAQISAVCDANWSAGDTPGRLVFSTTADGASSPTERMRIVNTGDILLNKTATDDTSAGFAWRSSNYFSAVRSGGAPGYINRLTNDGALLEFAQDSVTEGSISVSGTTVSYNGAHLSRWSQLPGGATREEILRGTVLSNIDEMCNWGEEENEQLNRMKVSDVEGDSNVAGVFQAWDDDDDTYTDDFYCAMTGDFIIRIAEGVTVQRGDLLMSAGDGTAKPQDDDIIRSKTVAKVTSTHVTCTYEDGSYCVPCVLMAC